jgi:hypothetical protein
MATGWCCRRRRGPTEPSGPAWTQSVDFASYGTPGGKCGNFSLDNNCHAATSQQVVEGLCLGQARCSVPADNNTFGDPCFGTQKRLYVQVSCG